MYCIRGSVIVKVTLVERSTVFLKLNYENVCALTI